MCMSLFYFRFRQVIVKETIHNVLNEHLSGKSYDAEETTEWTRRISDDIKLKLKGTLYGGETKLWISNSG